jgi:hypothetical protein
MYIKERKRRTGGETVRWATERRGRTLEERMGWREERYEAEERHTDRTTQTSASREMGAALIVTPLWVTKA